MVLISEARRAGDSMLLTQCSADAPAGGSCGHLPPQAGQLRFAKFHVPEIVFGPGSLPEAAHAAARLGARRPFVVTTAKFHVGNLMRKLLVSRRAEAVYAASKLGLL